MRRLVNRVPTLSRRGATYQPRGSTTGEAVVRRPGLGGYETTSPTRALQRQLASDDVAGSRDARLFRPFRAAFSTTTNPGRRLRLRLKTSSGLVCRAPSWQRAGARQDSQLKRRHLKAGRSSSLVGVLVTIRVAPRTCWQGSLPQRTLRATP